MDKAILLVDGVEQGEVINTYFDDIRKDVVFVVIDENSPTGRYQVWMMDVANCMLIRRRE